MYTIVYSFLFLFCIFWWKAKYNCIQLNARFWPIVEMSGDSADTDVMYLWIIINNINMSPSVLIFHLYPLKLPIFEFCTYILLLFRFYFLEFWNPCMHTSVTNGSDSLEPALNALDPLRYTCFKNQYG